MKSSTDYISKSRRKRLSFQLQTDLQTNAWQGWRDPLYVAEYCSEFPVPSAELRAFADIGQALDGEGYRFYRQLSRNHLKFPGRTRALKKRWADFRWRLTTHLIEAARYRSLLNGRDGEGVMWDSMKGWCAYERLRRNQ